jgi:uncharacterized protein YycO
MPPLQPGNYVCVQTGSLFGRLIRAFTRSPYDHAFIYCGNGQIVEATARGVRLDSLSLYAGARAVANTGEAMTDAQRATVVAAARSTAGREYNFADITVIALRLLGFRWKWLKRAADDRDADICSEDVCEAGAAAGLDWQCGEPDPAFVTPADLARRPGVVPVSI